MPRMKTVGVATGWSVPQSADPAVIYRTLQPGSILAGRYEIIQMLGKGGMGAVFKARDLELDRLVALKVIRPELAEDPEVLMRFKQELILARKITHKNVIRIFDLGQAEGIKFITMEYVEGQDLRQILTARGKLAPGEAIPIIQQICQALDAAHSEGVIHRDLKPQNIMLDAQGKVFVMDFGIARSLEAPSATQTGTLLGTPEYMSPEQAKAEPIDTRSDLFTLGIIFYELITGRSPYKADTAMGTLLKRIQERAIPPMEVDQSIPPSLSGVVVKCLCVDREQRYQKASEILHDLETGKSPALPPPEIAKPEPIKKRGLLQWIVAGAGVLIIAVLGFFLLQSRNKSEVPSNKVVTLLIADFENGTSDAIFDGTLESSLSLALEGASFISSYRRGDARKIAAQLRPGSDRMDETLARLVAVREGVNVVVSGSIGRKGDAYSVAVKAVDAANGKVIVAREDSAKNKVEVLSLVAKLAVPVRKSLGDSTPESAQTASIETYSAGSLEAAHEYAQAQEFQWAGKTEQAAASYKKAVELDQNMGRAFAGLAAVNANLGRRQDSEKYYKDAMARIDRMSEREKYRTLGGYYLSVRNPEKAIEQLTEMVQKYPADSAGFSNLAYAYSLRRNLTKALEYGRKAVEIYPKNLIQHNNVAIYALYAGDFETAIKEAKSVLESNPGFLKAHVVTALSELSMGHPDQAVEQYKKLEQISDLGASFAAIGLADLAMYEGRSKDAVEILEKRINAETAAKSGTLTSSKLAALATARRLSGKLPQSLADAEKVLSLDKSETIAYQTAHFYVEAGQEAKAAAIAASLGGQLLPEPRAYGGIIEGEILLKKGNAGEAARRFLDAQKLVDTWIGRFFLGLAYMELGQFPEAHTELELCLKRRGEATAIFLDEVPSCRFFPPLFYYLGKVHDGMKSTEAADSYKSFLAIKQRATDSDSMITDARRLLAGR